MGLNAPLFGFKYSMMVRLRSFGAAGSTWLFVAGSVR